MPNTGRNYALHASVYRTVDRSGRPYTASAQPATSLTPSSPKSAYYSHRGPSGASQSQQFEMGSADSLGSYPLRRPSAMYGRDDVMRVQSAMAERSIPRSRVWLTSQDESPIVRLPVQSNVGRSTNGSARRLSTTVVDARESFGAESQPLFSNIHRHGPSEMSGVLPRLSSLLKRAAPTDRFDDEDRSLLRKRPRALSPDRIPTKFVSSANPSSGRADDIRDSYEKYIRFGGRPELKTGDGRLDEAQAYPVSRSSRSNVSMFDPRHYSQLRSLSQEDVDYERRTAQRRAVDGDEEAGVHGPDRFGLGRTPEVVQQVASRRSAVGDAQRQPSYAVAESRRAPTYDLFRDHQDDSATSSSELKSNGRYSSLHHSPENVHDESVIEAAADLIDERSPSKRESITKLLLKSKDFLKAKSLVRNRNNEIDWVATFLNVGFESNSIYALMCPLRKGRWKVEEEKYTMDLLRLIENGTIRLRHGQSIRGFIAKKLHSDDMRVLKKLSNCKMFHFARMINPRMSDEDELDMTVPDARANLDRLEKLKGEFLRSVQLEALVAVRKYLSDSSIRDLLNGRD